MFLRRASQSSSKSDPLFGAALKNAAAKKGHDGLSTDDDCWTVLLVDDDEAVHELSRLVLEDYKFEGKSLKLLHAYSGAECRNMMRAEGDIAVALIDVIMETDTAGLDAVNYIRNVLGNDRVRILIRSGQPGLLSEIAVTTEYAIDSYLEKSYLTAQHLYDEISNALKAYRNFDA